MIVKYAHIINDIVNLPNKYQGSHMKVVEHLWYHIEYDGEQSVHRLDGL